MLRTVARRVPRGRYRLAAVAPSHGRFISTLAADAGGARFQCDLADELSREVCLTGVYEPPVTRVIRAHLTPGGCLVDAGANWGYFTLLAASTVGSSGHVFALEPDPRQFATLRANVALNGFDRVTLLPQAAAARPGRAVLHGYDDEDSNRGVSRLGSPGAAPVHDDRAFSVECVTIDDLTSARPAVDVVKIDVEGAEDDVLEGMRAGLAAHRYRAIMLELHPTLLRGKAIEPERVLRTFLEYGYHGQTIDMSPSAYRRAIDPRVATEALLLPLESWSATAWPHLLWRC